MSQNQIILLALTPLFLFDALLVFVILPRWVASMWQPFADNFPPVEPAPGAIRRRFQSFSIGILNLGFSIHVAADEHHLHLYPTLFARLFRITPVSIPWDVIKPGRFGRADIAGTSVHMPRWCRQLAARDPQST